MGTVVKKQHYIWRKYLSQWTESGDRYTGKLFVLRKQPKGNQNKIEYRELEKIGYEKYYYDVTGFHEKDIQNIKKLIMNMQRNELVKLGLSEDIFTDATNQRDFIEKRVMCNSENIDTEHHFLESLLKGDFSFYEDSKNQRIINELNKKLFCSILYREEFSIEQMQSIVKDFSLEESTDLKYEFNRFFCMQYFRSPKVHTDIKNNMKKLKPQYKEANDLNINFLTNMITIYFAERMALNISQNFQSNILLYKNNTNIPFVTGDTPIICLTGDKMDKASLFFYPISPQVAIILTVSPLMSFVFSAENRLIELNQNQSNIVKGLNNELANNCVNEVYSNSERILLDLSTNQ